MSNFGNKFGNQFPRLSGLKLSGLKLLPVALLALAATYANAQASPQLLPYTVKLIAGGGTNVTKGNVCPSGLTSTDAFGDGCLATEINIAVSTTSGSGPRYAIADKNGAVFFSDGTNGLVRRVDPITGIVTAVAGGATSSPSSGTVCGTGTSTDADGDGCPANLVKISHPMGLAFDATGNLYFVDEGFDEVRKIAATAGVITTTGIISHVAGNISTYGYNVNNTATSGSVNAATQGYLNFPYGIAFDAAGNIYIADEGNNAIEVINTGTATQTIQGLSLPAGTIAKFAGYGSLAAKTAASGDCPDFVSTSSRGGCYFGKWTDGALANVSNNDAVYSLTVGSTGQVYFTNEFNDNVGVITSANVISNYAGIQGSVLKKLQRGIAGTFAIGSNFGIASDVNDNVYITDASNGAVWRVDSVGKFMYPIAGGAATVCSSATDALGDNCPALQATFGSSGTSFASTTLPGPGIFGVTVDPYADLFVGDTTTGLIREIASGTQFGVVGANQPTNTLDIHFGQTDGPAATAAYAITAGANNFSLGTASCIANSDNTMDCLLPLTATPSALGLFTGTLTVTSKQGKVSAFLLSGTYAQSPTTRTSLSYTVPGVTCTGTTYATTSPVAFSSTLVANGPSAPTGTITFFANGTQIGAAQSVVNLGTTAAPVYGATLSNTFSTPNTYSVKAVYSGDTYFKTSTSPAVTLTTSAPSFTTAPVSDGTQTVHGGCPPGIVGECSISAGQTALYSFTLSQNVYLGTLTFACSGLPANSSCIFSPSTISANGCSTTNTVAFSVLTQQGSPLPAGIGIGSGPLQTIVALTGLVLALLLGLRRRSLRFGQLWLSLALLLTASGMLACGKGAATTPPTPSGNYTITVTTTGTSGTPSVFTVPLTVK